MVIQVHNNTDFGGNEAINLVLHKIPWTSLATLIPSPKIGQLYYATDLNKPFVYSTTGWLELLTQGSDVGALNYVASGTVLTSGNLGLVLDNLDNVLTTHFAVDLLIKHLAKQIQFTGVGFHISTNTVADNLIFLDNTIGDFGTLNGTNFTVGLDIVSMLNSIDVALGNTTFVDNTFRIVSSLDATKKLAIGLGLISLNTTRTLIMPDSDVDLGLIHLVNQDSSLDLGGANQVSAIDLKTHITDASRHFLINDTSVGLAEVWSASKVSSHTTNTLNPHSVTIRQLIPFQATPPLLPVDGAYWTRSTDHILFCYDSVFGKWLSVHTFEFICGRSGTRSNTYLRGIGGKDSLKQPYVPHTDMAIVGIRAYSSSIIPWTLEVILNGGITPILTLPVGVVGSAIDMTPKVNILIDSKISLYMNGINIKNSEGYIYMRLAV